MRISLRKAVRGLRRDRTQTFGVVITVLLGVMLFITSGGAFRNLSDSYQATYARLGFADLVATSAPAAATAVADAAREAGADAVTVRTQLDHPLQIGGVRLLGRLSSLPVGSRAAVDDVDVIAGEYLSAADPDGVLVETHAAQTFGIGPGDTLKVATAQGWHTVTVRGVVDSAEYLWPARNRQEAIGDPHSFAVIFAGADQIAQWTGAEPNQVLVRLADASGHDTSVGVAGADGTRKADHRQVLDAMYAAGADDVTSWEEQASHATLKEDLDGFEVMSVAFPALFLVAATVAAWVLLTRRVLSERGLIGGFMASGARRSRVVAHYVLTGILLGMGGAVAGTVLGAPLTALVTGAYTDALGIPDTVAVVHGDLVLWGLALGFVVGVLGAAAPAVTAARTVPAEAMRNQTVVRVPGWWSRWVASLRWLPAWVRMALRDVVRNPRRTLATALGSVLALILVLATLGMFTSFADAIDQQFNRVQLQDADVVVAATSPSSLAATLRALGSLDGVTATERVQTARVTVRAGGESYTTNLTGMADSTMHGFYALDGTRLQPATGEILAGSGLVDQLDVAVGDMVTVTDVATGHSAEMRLAGLLEEPMGTVLYTTPASVDRLVGADPPTTDVMLQFADGVDRDAMRAKVTAIDGVLAYTDSRALFSMIDDYLGLFWVFIGVLIAMGAVLAFAVISVTMAVTLVERTGELATLRASGVGVPRVSAVLATENLLAISLGIPPGLLAGYVAAGAFLSLFSNDIFQIPLRLGWPAMVLAALGVLGAAALSQVLAARSIRRLDVARVVRERAT